MSTRVGAGTEAPRTRAGATIDPGMSTRPAAAPRPATRRPTRQRTAIAHALGESDQFRSAQDLHASLDRRGVRVGLATVYRALQAMVADGEADVLRTEDGEALYRACSPHHHHHLVCRSCGLAVEVEAPPVERWAAQVGTSHGFTDVAHTLEVIGTCSACRT